MVKNRIDTMRPTLISLGVLAVMSFGFASTPAAAQSLEQREDELTCASFGMRFGTPDFGYCMLELQRRRGSKSRNTLEEMAITSQIAKDGQLMAERARRQRCDRDPDRRECRRR